MRVFVYETTLRLDKSLASSSPSNKCFRSSILLNYYHFFFISTKFSSIYFQFFDLKLYVKVPLFVHLFPQTALFFPVCVCLFV